MTKLTKERVKQFISQPLEHGLIRGEQMEMARQMLTGMEQEPVGWMTEVEVDELHRGLAEEAYIYRIADCASTIPLYSTPQLPQSVVPNEIGKIRVGRLPTMNQDDYPGLGDWWVQLRIGEDSDEVLARVYGATPQEANNRAEALACRAAMLQGETDGNSPVIPDGWVACSERMPEVGEVVLTAEDGCVNVGEAERSGSNYRYFTPVVSGRELPATHWMPMPAAPQQETN